MSYTFKHFFLGNAVALEQTTMISKVGAQLLLLLLLATGSTRAQTPTGTIAGVVTDPAGAPVVAARVNIINIESGLTRNLTTSMEGDYSAAALPPGVYRVTAEATGFSLLQRTATVETGTTTTVNLILQIGEVREQVTVTDAAPLINYESNAVSGVVSREQIENLPLNGRNFLDLAKLHPGVPQPVRTNTRTFVTALGAGFNNPRIGNTRVSVDGASITAIGSIGSSLEVSQEVVREFQIATVNFDISTGLTSNGAINIVTRSGGKQFHGSGFYYYRDHNLAAYPGLQRDSSDADPFFQRDQFGFQIGGPIARDRVFFFTSYERNDQRGVISIQPRTPEFAPLGGVFPSPLVGNQFNVRFDARVHPQHNAFLRYTHDGNRAFAPALGLSANSLPSGWSRLKRWVDQSMVGLTSVLSPNLVNDLRFSYFFESTPETPATHEDCPGCLGVGAPRINIADAGVSFGEPRRTSFVGRRYQLTNGVVWQRSNHRLRFGFDWEHAVFSLQLITNEPAAIELYSPQQVREFNASAPALAQIPLPSSFLTFDDILRLPLRTFQTSIGPGSAAQRDFRKRRRMDLYRLYAANTWRINSRLTLNYGLAWAYEPNGLNTDLSKPPLLTAILGADNLHPPTAQKTNFAPALGFAWAATRDGKTVIRAGAGLYFDPVTLNPPNVERDRIALSPAGTGSRANVQGSSIFHQGRALAFRQRPTTFTGADLLAILPGIRAELAQQLNPGNRDFTFRNIDLNKTGQNLTDPFYEAPYALHFNLGAQRELASDLVLSADLVLRRFLHTYFSGIDYNHFNSARGPVIPVCTSAQQNDVTAVCSAGPITFDHTTGIAEYKGLLVRLEKRFSRRTQFLASYALGSFKGSNGSIIMVGTGFNNDDWFENYGPLPTDLRHILNISGLVELRWRFQLSFSVSANSRPPFAPYVSGVDFNGDGTQNDLLPGTRVNQFNRGLTRDDLARLVDRYDLEVAGRPTPGGQTAPPLTLPAEYSFNDNFFTQDLRLSRTFPLGEHTRLILFGEVFNLLNTANLVGYDANLANPAEFGQPGARSTQVFGSGGPRAFQLGVRISF